MRWGSTTSAGSRELAVPGDLLGIAEEFLAGPGAYEENYRVRAAVLGYVVRDTLGKVASVRPIRYPNLPTPGSVVVGVVTEVRDEYARVRIDAVGDKVLQYPFTGILHIVQITERVGSTARIYDLVRLGDVVRAKVLSSRPPYILTAKEPKLGVVLASCSLCGATLRPSGDKLVCPRCGNTERRKVAQGYGHV